MVRKRFLQLLAIIPLVLFVVSLDSIGIAAGRQGFAPGDEPLEYDRGFISRSRTETTNNLRRRLPRDRVTQIMCIIKCKTGFDSCTDSRFSNTIKDLLNPPPDSGIECLPSGECPDIEPPSSEILVGSCKLNYDLCVKNC